MEVKSITSCLNCENITSTFDCSKHNIEVDVDKGSMNLLVDDNIIKKRLESYEPVLPEIKSGYQKMYIDHVMQADKGADLDFLVGKRGSEVKRHSH